MKIVIKRDKKRQRYSLAKIKRAIDRAAKQAKLSLNRRKKLMHEIADKLNKDLAKKAVIKSTELRTKILRRLNTHAKAVAKAWRVYEKERKKRK